MELSNYLGGFGAEVSSPSPQAALLRKTSKLISRAYHFKLQLHGPDAGPTA